MKNDSPNKFLGGIASIGAAFGRGAAAGGNFDRAKYERLAQMGGVFGKLGQQVLDQNPVAPAAPVAPTADISAGAAMSGGDMQDPFAGKTFSIVESPANMKGNAKPVFNESTSDAAAMMYGSPLERQMSMPKAGTSAMSMSAKQEKAFGPGSEVYESGNTAIYEGLKEKE